MPSVHLYRFVLSLDLLDSRVGRIFDCNFGVNTLPSLRLDNAPS